MHFDTGRLDEDAYIRLYTAESGEHIRFVVGYKDSQSAALDSHMTLSEAKAVSGALRLLIERLSSPE